VQIGATQMMVLPLILLCFLVACIFWRLSIYKSRQVDTMSRTEGIPGCESRPVVHELRDTYGKQPSSLLSLIPSDYVATLFFDLRRAKQTTYDPTEQTRNCAGEYNSLLGLGTLTYQIAWFDAANKNDGRVQVRITEINSPETVRLVGQLLDKMASSPATHHSKQAVPH